MIYNYYYNKSGDASWRNNLVYTSLVNESQTVFVKWYHNDTEYHNGKNQVVDPELMDEKWNRELKYLKLMHGAYSSLVPKILDIDEKHRKIYLEIDGPDFWQRSLDGKCTFDAVLPDWQEQMIDIVKAHKKLGLHKYSMHPSSYFVVNGRLKSINYFFTYHKDEPFVSVKDVESHIHVDRQFKMRNVIPFAWDSKQSWETMDDLCWESFRSNYPDDFIDKVKCIK